MQMSDPGSNSATNIERLFEIEKQIDSLSLDAHFLLRRTNEEIVGRKVRRYGKTFSILNCIEHRGIVKCYGAVVFKRDGSIGRRGYDLGRLSQCEFVEEAEN